MTIASAAGRAIRWFALPGLFALTACGGLSSETPPTVPSTVSPAGPHLPVAYDHSLSELESLTVSLLLLDSGEAVFDMTSGKRVVPPSCVAMTAGPDRDKIKGWGQDVRPPSNQILQRLAARSPWEFVSIAHCQTGDNAHWIASDGRIAVYVWVERIDCPEPEDRRPGVWCLDVGSHVSPEVANGYTVRAERDGDRFHLKTLESWTT